MAALRTFHHAHFAPADLVAAKAGRRVSVCLPARDEAETVGPIVAAVREALLEAVALVDEILVLDDHSADATATAAADAGARVVAAGDVAPEFGDEAGKGQALWKTVLVSQGDLIVWCDADVRDFDPAFVTGLLGPLLTEP
ncbi:MAG: glycosyltransferase, partial [Acidimicrobiales bacterium]